MMPRLTYALAAYTAVLLCAATTLEASPLPQGSESLSTQTPQTTTISSAPSSISRSAPGEPVGMSNSTRYYVLAISICGASFALFTIAMLYRLKTRHRHNDTTTISGLERNPGTSGAAHSVPLQHILSKVIMVLSEAQFNLLPRKAATGQTSSPASDASLVEPESCSICLCNVKAGDPLVFLVPCHHAFHDACVGQWLMQKSTLCPLCKADTVKGLNLVTIQTSSDLAGQDSTQVVGVTATSNPSPQSLQLAEEFEHRLL